jgi:hypothetical protein
MTDQQKEEIRLKNLSKVRGTKYSSKEIAYIKEAVRTFGGDKRDIYKRLAKELGRTSNSIARKFQLVSRRYKIASDKTFKRTSAVSIQDSKVKRNLQNMLSLDIKDIQIDLVSRKILIFY